ncbi:MAG: energy-coupling factor transporter transmembrane protein EcfT [Erysipelotrichaceae bacterium]|jgi:energy-coupling factor transport system permease protein|nr:energy-coupling factor transporter transmembrane protein EcfT [Erysipelotrichaceae bacterium]
MNNIALGRYLPLDSVIHRMDPRAKIGAMLLLMIAIFIPAGYTGYMVIGVAVVLAALLAKLKFSFLWRSMKPMLFMLVFLLIINILIVKEGFVILQIGSFAVYSEAIMQTLYIVIRLMLMIMITTILTATTKPLDLTLGIEDLLKPFQVIHVPSHEIAMIISLALRFIPTLIEETQRIMKAQASRGVDMEEGSLKEKVMGILSLIVPLFVSAFQRADELANAMEARGYIPNKKRTRYKQLKMAGKDYILLLISVCILAFMISIQLDILPFTVDWI